jgi:hypothetical protein
VINAVDRHSGFVHYGMRVVLCAMRFVAYRLHLTAFRFFSPLLPFPLAALPPSPLAPSSVILRERSDRRIHPGDSSTLCRVQLILMASNYE